MGETFGGHVVDHLTTAVNDMVAILVLKQRQCLTFVERDDQRVGQAAFHPRLTNPANAHQALVDIAKIKGQHRVIPADTGGFHDRGLVGVEPSVNFNPLQPQPGLCRGINSLNQQRITP